MNMFTPLGILILIMFIMAFLQFIPSFFLLFSHFSHGQMSRKNASKLGRFYIFGAYLGILFIFLLFYFTLTWSNIFFIVNQTILSWIFCGIFFATSLIMFFLYYRKGKNTELFVSRKLVQKYIDTASRSKTPSEAFFLGFISIIPELIFTIPLFACATAELTTLLINPFITILYIILITLSAIIPLLLIHGMYNRHSNLAIIQKFRVKNKTFIKCFLGLLYLLIATIIITFRIVS